MVLCDGGAAHFGGAVMVVENEEIRWDVVLCWVHESEGGVAQK